MLTFTTFFLSLGIVGGALAHSYERTYGTNHVALAVCLIGIVAFTLFLMQATIAGFEALTAVIFWIVGYGVGWLACLGIDSNSHKGHKSH
jgi:hypothetical protein